MQECAFGSLICIVVDRVPLTFRLDRMGVLFCLINEKTLSSPALLWRLPKMWSRSQSYCWERGITVSLHGHTFFNVWRRTRILVACAVVSRAMTEARILAARAANVIKLIRLARETTCTSTVGIRERIFFASARAAQRNKNTYGPRPRDYNYRNELLITVHNVIA